MNRMCTATTNLNNEKGITVAIVTCCLDEHDEETLHVSRVKHSEPAATIRWFGRAPAPRKDN